MIREIVTDKEVLQLECDDIDVTAENGIYFSVFKPSSCLIKDLLDTAGHYSNFLSILCANQIGYLGKALVLKYEGEFIPIMNPSVIRRDGGRVKDHRSGIKYCKEVKLRFWAMDGKKHEVLFRGGYSKAVQGGLRLLGIV